MNKSIEQYNDIQGTAVANFRETQHFINLLVGNTEKGDVLYDDISYDYAVENSLNHINLDISDDAIHSQDIVATRIFPNKIMNRFSYNDDHVLFDSEKIKDLSILYYKKIQMVSTKGLDQIINGLVTFDAYCEAQLQKCIVWMDVLSQAISNIASKASKKDAAYIIKVPKPVSLPKTYKISIQESSARGHLEVPVSYTHKKTVVQEVVQTVPQEKNESMFAYIFSLIYAELRYGGTLDNVDSI